MASYYCSREIKPYTEWEAHIFFNARKYRYTLTADELAEQSAEYQLYLARCEQYKIDGIKKEKSKKVRARMTPEHPNYKK